MDTNLLWVAPTPEFHILLSYLGLVSDWFLFLALGLSRALLRCRSHFCHTFWTVGPYCPAALDPQTNATVLLSPNCLGMFPQSPLTCTSSCFWIYPFSKNVARNTGLAQEFLNYRHSPLEQHYWVTDVWTITNGPEEAPPPSSLISPLLWVWIWSLLIR